MTRHVTSSNSIAELTDFLNDLRIAHGRYEEDRQRVEREGASGFDDGSDGYESL